MRTAWPQPTSASQQSGAHHTKPFLHLPVQMQRCCPMPCHEAARALASSCGQHGIVPRPGDQVHVVVLAGRSCVRCAGAPWPAEAGLQCLLGICVRPASDSTYIQTCRYKCMLSCLLNVAGSQLQHWYWHWSTPSPPPACSLLVDCSLQCSDLHQLLDCLTVYEKLYVYLTTRLLRVSCIWL